MRMTTSLSISRWKKAWPRLKPARKSASRLPAVKVWNLEITRADVKSGHGLKASVLPSPTMGLHAFDMALHYLQRPPRPQPPPPASPPPRPQRPRHSPQPPQPPHSRRPQPFLSQQLRGAASAGNLGSSRASPKIPVRTGVAILMATLVASGASSGIQTARARTGAIARAHRHQRQLHLLRYLRRPLVTHRFCKWSGSTSSL
mmetsp:Transcript_45504/g.105117  ORF Transcript_45504/g.105117 Transcript_45504/m.105117 type:complete len:202 (-) Transcript_45504:691-1296(-)